MDCHCMQCPSVCICMNNTYIPSLLVASVNLLYYLKNNSLELKKAITEHLNADKFEATFLCHCTSKEGFPSTWGSIQQHTWLNTQWSILKYFRILKPKNTISIKAFSHRVWNQSLHLAKLTGPKNLKFVICKFFT